MWILTPLQSGGETQYLVSGKDYVVGRKNCDILLPNDQSISRAHAHFTATEQTLTLKDTSKYGTFVNSQRLMGDEPLNLKSGDSVTFGVFHSKFSVDHLQPVVCSSCLDNNGKVSLSQALLPLGGKLVNTWTQDCTHLVMPIVKVTIKTISALLCCRPVVKPEYFSELIKAMQQKLPLPKAERFIPVIDEPSLSKEDVNLGAIPIRKQLFTGKTFIFLSAKQLKRLSSAVTFGGGRNQLLEEGSLPLDLLESPQSCVVEFTTGSSQTLMSSTATEWAASVKNIVERKGLRLITESEIGLAAIYASCEKYCNPSSSPDSEPVPKVKPRIPSASLSQSVAVDETVLPATSQNITAYAANTEPSQRMELKKVTVATSVGETPDKRPNQNQQKKMDTQCIVAESLNLSYHAVEDTDSKQKTSKSKVAVSGGESNGIRSQSSFPEFQGGIRRFQQKQSPQKLKTSAQSSPQKQSTLTNFFQPVSKKRPLEDDLSAVMPEPKKPVWKSSMTMQAPSVTSKETPIQSEKIPAAASQTPLGSVDDLFLGRSEASSDVAEKEAQSRKRKELEEEIKMDELESIMSLDMDCFDEQPSGQQVQSKSNESTKQKQVFNVVEASSKRQRLHLEDSSDTSRRQQANLEKESRFRKNQDVKSEQHSIRIKMEPLKYSRGSHESSKPSAATNQNVSPFEEDDVEDLELLKAEIGHPKELTETPVKPVTIKQEIQESKIEEDLLKKLVLVEFRSLTVTAPPKKAPWQMLNNGYAKNFKCFRKVHVQGSEGSAHIIGGSDLLVHNRGKNSDLDEWLKDAAEEERQSRRDESVGDDLFRYNPTKLAKRR
ncbi:nibrin [Sphaeramia orbicularis]|uniref:nibrin n=1 Tax=Sphaeramia orbicularis TaxID=375764 RepID=UPI00117EE996|nr:nibrin [Sphaeramia orbicularis]